jgi:hypothetical protein
MTRRVEPVPLSQNDYRRRLIAARERLGLGHAEMAQRLLTPLYRYMEWESAARATPGAAVIAAEALVRTQLPQRQATGRPPVRMEKFAALADGTRTRAEVAEAMEWSIHTLDNYIWRLRRRGGDPLFTDGAKRTSRAAAAEMSAAIAALADGTRTRGEVAAALGVTVPDLDGYAHRIRVRGGAAEFKRKFFRGGTAPQREEQNAEGRAAASKERLDTITRRLADGATLREIGAELGVSHQRVAQIADAHSISRPRSREIWEEKRAESEREREQRQREKEQQQHERDALESKLLSLVRAGRSIRSVASEYDFSEETLRASARRAGVASQHGRWRGTNTPGPGTIMHRVWQLADGTRTIGEIAAEMKTSGRVVRERIWHLRRRGLDIKVKPEP